MYGQTVRAEVTVPSQDKYIAMYGQTVRGQTSLLVRVWAIREAECGKAGNTYLWFTSAPAARSASTKPQCPCRLA